mmetsp:Transcript_11774/g.30229  ORF Transcript_11774/g.30229 Transcript_11774/m.30229 type:complete len:91 (+) Transcript_11774:199-471(+)
MAHGTHDEFAERRARAPAKVDALMPSARRGDRAVAPLYMRTCAARPGHHAQTIPSFPSTPLPTARPHRLLLPHTYEIAAAEPSAAGTSIW